MILTNAILLVLCYFYKKELKKNEELERELKELLPQIINDAEAEKKALSGRVNTLEEATRKRQLESVISFLHERCEHDN